LGQRIEVPQRLAALADKEKVADLMPPEFDNVKGWLLDNLG
jgi:hypothetical protein